MITIRELSKYINVSPQTIRCWVRQGKLPYYRLGRGIRFSEVDRDQLLAMSRIEATNPHTPPNPKE